MASCEKLTLLLFKEESAPSSEILCAPCEVQLARGRCQVGHRHRQTAPRDRRPAMVSAPGLLSHLLCHRRGPGEASILPAHRAGWGPGRPPSPGCPEVPRSPHRRSWPGQSWTFTPAGCNRHSSSPAQYQGGHSWTDTLTQPWGGTSGA